MKKCIEIKNKAKCCGCTACLAICPVNAIEMRDDKEGFNYPFVHSSKCINCGLCQSVCPVIMGNSYGKTQDLFAIKNRNATTRLSSSSGGVFSAIADAFDVVYGAVFNNKNEVVHKRAVNGEWMQMKTSKYVQSDLKTNHIFQSVKKDLLNQKEVLFVGTACQVAGLKLYLKNVNTSKLVTCDIVCHGVPSPKVWKDYLNYLEKKYQKKITDINFRDKKPSGWHETYLTIKSDETIIVSEPHLRNLYSQLYFRNLILRPICYQCAYTNLNRPGDMTLGDFWGVEKNYPNLDDDKGLSIVGINNEKGHLLFDRLKLTCDIQKIPPQHALQPNLVEPSYRPSNRDWFWAKYSKKGIEYVGKRLRLLPRSLMDEVEIKIDVIIERILKQ